MTIESTETGARDAGSLTDGEAEATITSFGVGHGDCTLVELMFADRILWRGLFDAGTSIPDELLARLKAQPREDDAPDIDLLVLSHVDADHLGGMEKLLEHARVGEYWGPCLPTFRRLSWLFADRVKNAVEQTSKLEKSLRSSHVEIKYPLEGFTRKFADGKVTLTVVSPARQLIRFLSLGGARDVVGMLHGGSIPSSALLGELPPLDDDDRAAMGAAFLEDSITADQARVLVSEDLGRALSAADRNSLVAAADPQFFGNRVLNDTSLIVLVDLQLGQFVRKRLLLCGDQENWTYVADRHPAGLGADIVKAPHHGGRVYLGKRREAYDDVLTWLRPKTVFVSANGQHNLPRREFRDTLRKVGATLLCPNVRGFQPLSAGAVKEPAAKSCKEAYGCNAEQQQTVSFVLSATSEWANKPACLEGRGYDTFAPLVLMQEVRIPSDVAERYTSQEIEHRVKWVKDAIRDEHRLFVERASSIGGAGERASLAAQQMIAWDVIEARARSRGKFELVADPQPIFKHARLTTAFWVSSDDARWPTAIRVSPWPANKDIEKAIEWVAGIPRILAKIERPPQQGSTSFDILKSADWSILIGLIAIRLRTPREYVEVVLLPMLLQRLSEVTTLKKVCAYYPFRASSIGGPTFLLACSVGRVPPLPDLSAPPWQECLDVRKMEEVNWKRFEDLANEGLLACTAFPKKVNYGSGEWWLKPFYEAHQNPSSFDVLLEKAQWLAC